MDSFIQVRSHFEKDPNLWGKALPKLLSFEKFVDVVFELIIVVELPCCDFRWLGFFLLFRFRSDDSFFFFHKHLFEFVNDFIVINVALIIVILILQIVVDKHTISIVESAFLVAPSALLIIFKEEIVALQLEANSDSVRVKLLNKVFPSGVWFAVWFHSWVYDVYDNKWKSKNISINLNLL